MNRTKIVCIGDSLTEGYGIQPTDRWSTLLSNDLNIEVINSGISGDTTAGMLARFHEMVIKHKPTYTIIMGGTNDIWLNLPDNSIIGNILAMTRHATYHDIIPIIGIPTPFFTPEDCTDQSQFIEASSIHNRIHSFQEILKQFALDDHQHSIDFTLHMNPTLFLKDGLHPNEKGHKQMSIQAALRMKAIFNRM